MAASFFLSFDFCLILMCFQEGLFHLSDCLTALVLLCPIRFCFCFDVFVLEANSLLLNRPSLGASFHWGHSGITAHIKVESRKQDGLYYRSALTPGLFFFKACDKGTKPTSVPIKMPWCLLIEKRGTAEVSAQLTGWLM